MRRGGKLGSDDGLERACTAEMGQREGGMRWRVGTACMSWRVMVNRTAIPIRGT